MYRNMSEYFLSQVGAVQESAAAVGITCFGVELCWEFLDFVFAEAWDTRLSLFGLDSAAFGVSELCCLFPERSGSGPGAFRQQQAQRVPHTLPLWELGPQNHNGDGFFGA